MIRKAELTTMPLCMYIDTLLYSVLSTQNLFFIFRGNELST
jgi:hypothetical protein